MVKMINRVVMISNGDKSISKIKLTKTSINLLIFKLVCFIVVSPRSNGHFINTLMSNYNPHIKIVILNFYRIYILYNYINSIQLISLHKYTTIHKNLIIILHIIYFLPIKKQSKP